MRFAFTAVLIAVSASAASIAQTAVAPSNPDTTIRSTAKEVLVDVVIRDKHERFVKDLRPDEVEVYENGVKQTLKDFQLVQGKSATQEEQRIRREAAARSGPSGVQSIRDLNVVSIVFSHIGWEQTFLAQKAAEQFLHNELRPNMLVGVFVLSHRLYAIRSFTNDRATLEAGVKRATTGAYSQYPADSAAALADAEATITSGRGGISTTAGLDLTSPSAGTASAEVSTGAAAQLMYAILNGERTAMANVGGMEEMDALENLIAAQARLPGRKTVLLVTTGVAVPPAFKERFRHVISASNRAGVTFYGIDANGVSMNSPLALSRSSINHAAALSASQATIDTQNSARAIGEAAAQDESILYGVGAANTQDSLAELAESTGGFLAANANDFKLAMRKIVEDVGTHYELAYSPQIDIYDGSYRTIEVRVNRPNTRIQSRTGYLALPELNGRQVFAYEVPALQALNAKPRPHDLGFDAAALRFHPGSMIQYSYVAEIPGTAITTHEDAANHARVINTVVLALIKNSDGEIVEKLSREFSLSIPDEKWPQFQAGKLIYSQPFYLRPGRYTLETAVVDRVSHKSAVQRSALVIPAPGSGPEISSVTLVRSVERRDAQEATSDPFQIAAARVTPTLSNALERNAKPYIYFIAYPKPGNTSPDITVELVRDGRVVAREKAVPSASTSEGFPVMFTPNLSGLETGVYDVRVTLAEGNVGARQSMSLTVN